MLEKSLLFCLILFVILLIAFYVFANIRLFSSIALSAIISMVVLVFVYPPMLLIAEEDSLAKTLYPMLLLLLFLVIFLYVIWSSCQDKRCKTKRNKKCVV